MRTAGSFPREILTVEDNPGDVLLMEVVLGDLQLPARLSAVGAGDEAVDFLFRRGDHAEAPVPDLVLLDLNLPRRDGWSVLAEIKGDERLRKIPVVVLTSSAAEHDLRRAWNNHANAVLTKPAGYDDYFQMLQKALEFWLESVSLPPREGARSA
jgi:CheY-like chemotaxis protein